MDATVNFPALHNLWVKLSLLLCPLNLFEYIITFELERRRIWARKRTAVTWIFIVNRYLAVAYSISMILLLCVTTRTEEVRCICSFVDNRVMVFSFLRRHIGLSRGLVQGVFSSLRIWALWPDKGVLCPVVVFSLYLVPFGTDIAGSTTNNTASIIGELISLFRVVVVNRLCVVAADIIVLSSTWIKTFGHCRELARLGLRTNVIHLFVRDGTISFLYWRQQQLYPIVISRFLLDLRQVDDLVDPDSDNPVVIASHIVNMINTHTSTTDPGMLGNLGGALYGPFDRVLENNLPNEEQGPAGLDSDIASTSAPLDEGPEKGLIVAELEGTCSLAEDQGA
ncbi:hypothetical protein BDY19DRAFT_907197 [Irpex rosettiformis]|uniref:Uncharacterized protein n=1 Tax=Irpex rosettiformis TaxID=378272 RepID=A0ACB8U160_9APHY|nr:hypothetical protein BDY19DRAFT_907197 [Irpex rosettiformis]